MRIVYAIFMVGFVAMLYSPVWAGESKGGAPPIEVRAFVCFEFAPSPNARKNVVSYCVRPAAIQAVRFIRLRGSLVAVLEGAGVHEIVIYDPIKMRKLLEKG